MESHAAAAAPAVRRESAEARRRVLRFHASTMMDGSTAAAAANAASNGPGRIRRASTPWAAMGPVVLSWADEDDSAPPFWVPPGTPSLPPAHARHRQAEESSPPASPSLGSRKDSLDALLSEREVLGTRTFAGHEAWSLRRPDDV
mmetsp:Transcript_98314/g.175057  ORF Transcript_98314/g.175057 Transcript_98314/m.175057 type:complete len:145 (+) Transcript_98314:95-529(+)